MTADDLTPGVRDHLRATMLADLAREREATGCACHPKATVTRFAFDPVAGGRYELLIEHEDHCPVTRRQAGQQGRN